MTRKEKLSQIIEDFVKSKTPVFIRFSVFKGISYNTFLAYYYQIIKEKNLQGKISRRIFQDGMELTMRGMRLDEIVIPNKFFKGLEGISADTKIIANEILNEEEKVLTSSLHEKCPQYFQDLLSGVYNKVVIATKPALSPAGIELLYEPPNTIKLTSFEGGTILELAEKQN